MKPTVFVASSREGIKYAQAIQQNLDPDCDVIVWDQGVFRPSEYTLESLSRQARLSDFSVFIFSPDDYLNKRNKNYKAVRSNVIFELGLFVGKSDISRCFMVEPKDGNPLDIPSDLFGITRLRFDSGGENANLTALLGAVSNEIRDCIRKKGKKSFLDREIYADFVAEKLKNRQGRKHINNISASTLEGFWLSRYEFISKRSDPSGSVEDEPEYTRGVQYNIEHIQDRGDDCAIAQNRWVLTTIKNPHYHIVFFEIFGSHLIGRWLDINTNNVGACQLHIVSNNENLMGQHLGNAADNSIQSGIWEWVRIDPGIDVEALKRRLEKNFEGGRGQFDQFFVNLVRDPGPVKDSDFEAVKK